MGRRFPPTDPAGYGADCRLYRGFTPGDPRCRVRTGSVLALFSAQYPSRVMWRRSGRRNAAGGQGASREQPRVDLRNANAEALPSMIGLSSWW